MSRILIIEDERPIAQSLAYTLKREGFEVAICTDGAEGLKQALAIPSPDLLILDLMLPSMGGLEICRTLRQRQRTWIPVIMLTAKAEEIDRVIGLEMGADDYLAKPFGSRELIARIKAVLRRSPGKADDVAPQPQSFHFDRWSLDTGARALLRDDGVTVPLSTGEYDLLVALVERPQRVLNRDQLLDLARGRSSAGLDRSIDTQVSRLRKKLERDPGDPQLIKTVWGGGYMLTPAVVRK